VARMGEHAGEASELLKALAPEGRLLILCELLHGEKSVGELEALLSKRQASVSQQLARRHCHGLVERAAQCENAGLNGPPTSPAAFSGERHAARRHASGA